MQLEKAAREGIEVQVTQRDGTSQRVATLYPHAWAHLVDRAELAGDTGTSHTYRVECGCAHCLVGRSEWDDTPAQPRSLQWWADRRRCRSQMLLLSTQTREDNREWGQHTLSALPMDLVDPDIIRADYDHWPQDEFHNDSCTRGFIVNEVLGNLAAQRDTGKHQQLERRFANAPRENQEVLKHFWNGVAKVTNASHTELAGIWRQMVCNVALLVSGQDWLAILTWGVSSAYLRRAGPISQHHVEEFFFLVNEARKALQDSSFNRTTTKSGHRKLQNLPWHDVVHGPHRIMLWGAGISTGFFEQMHELVLKRLRGGECCKGCM